jgi:phospholipase C
MLDILTQNPETWKKTILILCYDENDGYFDHVPPFVAPNPDRPETGKASAGLDTAVEQVSSDQERALGAEGRAGPIGLGYRVPLLIASPWTRGGYVCSQVFDHTSILQFLEGFLAHKTGKLVREKNISAWRRAVCGDLTAAFRPYHNEAMASPEALKWAPFAGSIHQAQFKPLPNGFRSFSPAEITQARIDPASSPLLPRQESGLRPSCALPYELSVDGALSPDRQAFLIEFAAGKAQFGDRSAGAPFHVYTPVRARARGKGRTGFEPGRAWAYTVVAGDRLKEAFPLRDFQDGIYDLRVHGPNGFFRQFQGAADDPLLQATFDAAPGAKASSTEVVLRLSNADSKVALAVLVDDLSYGARPEIVVLGQAGAANATIVVRRNLDQSFGWYDLRLRVRGAKQFEKRYAGRIETGREAMSDPRLGRVRPP